VVFSQSLGPAASTATQRLSDQEPDTSSVFRRQILFAISDALSELMYNFLISEALSVYR